MWGGRRVRPATAFQQDGWKGCKLTELADGSQLMTYYSDDGRTAASQLVAERYVGGIRVSVEANTLVGVSGEDATPRSWRSRCSTLEQLTEIASKPWWSLEAPLDSPYEDTLPSYEELTSGDNGLEARARPIAAPRTSCPRRCCVITATGVTVQRLAMDTLRPPVRWRGDATRQCRASSE